MSETAEQVTPWPVRRACCAQTALRVIQSANELGLRDTTEKVKRDLEIAESYLAGRIDAVREMVIALKDDDTGALGRLEQSLAKDEPTHSTPNHTQRTGVCP